MTPEQLQIYFDTSPAIRLLQAKNAPHIVCFLYESFKQARAIDIPHSDLISALGIYQERVQEVGPEILRDKPEDYLRDWSSPEKRWLKRFLESGRNEPMYQLTPHSEQVIEFLEQALQTDIAFVGTASRLQMVMLALEKLVIGASDDPEIRLQNLREERAQITAQIEDIESNGRVTKFAPTIIREQFSMAVRMLKQLQGDFREVEENFKVITRQVQHRQVQGLDSRSGILGDALGAEDELKRQDQGVSFFEFLRFIQSPQQQDRLQAVIQQLLHVQELAEQTDGLETVRHMVRGLLDEAEKVLQTTRRLSSSLRRLLDTRSQFERRRITEILREIRILAASRCDDPPRQIGVEVEQSIEICAPLSRTNWSPPARFERVSLVEHIVDEEERRRAFESFSRMRPIDWVGMRSEIERAVAPTGKCTLGELLSGDPPSGLVDVLGYLQIACDDGHRVRTDATEQIVLPLSEDDPRLLELTIPHVTFVRGGKP